MNRKWMFLAFSVSILFVLLSCSPGTIDVSGKYINKDNPKEYIDLKKDGTFYLKKEMWEFEGKWKVDGNILILSLAGERIVKGKIKGGIIRGILGGDTWAKKK